MFFYEGFICPVCKKKFHETEDIVSCPDCGAPHHRDCWFQHGGCRYAEDHGTSRQWKRPEDTNHSAGSAQAEQGKTPPPYSASSAQVRTCSRCGKVNPEYAEFCSRCGQTMSPPDWSKSTGNAGPNANGQPTGRPPYGAPFPGGFGGYGEYSPFHMPVIDPFGGVPKEEHIDDVSAEDIVTFVGPNSAYYLPRFLKMKRQESMVSWNWPAFLLTPYWLLYRKNYVAGGVVLFLSVMQTFINNLIMGLYIRPELDTSSYSAMYESMNALMEKGTHTIYFAIIFLLFAVNILVRLLFGLIGNSLYMRTAVTRIRAIRNQHGELPRNEADAPQYRHELVSKGGVSLILIAVASGIVWFGQLLLQAVFLYV